VNKTYHVSPVGEAERGALENILAWSMFVHRHLDWRTPHDWLGHDPFFLLGETVGDVSSNYVAVLACPPDPPQVAWVRLFGFVPILIQHRQAWQILWQAAQNWLVRQPEVQVAAAVIAETPWLVDALKESGFVGTHAVIGFHWQHATLPAARAVRGVTLRRMNHADLPAVCALDAQAFPALWHYSLKTLHLAQASHGIASVAVCAEEIIGYQISTFSSEGAHLSRLAVAPAWQGRGVGYLLVRDLLESLVLSGVFGITVNTQDYNSASQALYRKFGFRRDDSEYPVYEYPLKEGVQ